VKEFTSSDWRSSYHGADPERGGVDVQTGGLRLGKLPHLLANNLVDIRISDDCVDHPVYRGGQSFQFCERLIDKRRGEAPKKVRACPKHGLSKSHDIIVKQHGGTIDAVN
jgi:hypothetical protein